MSAPLLCKLHYDPAEGWGMIVLAVDASLDGWGGTLGQLDPEGRKRVARYESGTWNHAERRYDAGKRECRGLLKALQKTRFWLCGVHFVLELDANTLVAQLSRAATDLPGALVTRWLAWIQLFDFEVRHVKGTKHGAADGLSRRPRQDDDSDDELDIDEFVTDQLEAVGIARVGVAPPLRGRDVAGSADPFHESCQLTKMDRFGGTPGISLLSMETDQGMLVDNGSSNALHNGAEVRPMLVPDETRRSPDLSGSPEEQPSTGHPPIRPNETVFLDPLDDSYSEESQKIARFLTTLEKPEGMSRVTFKSFKQNCLKYSVRDRQLWRNGTLTYPPRLVVDSEKQRAEIIYALHDRTGHSGRETTYHKLAARYYWEGSWDKVAGYVKTCKTCQHRTKKRQEEALRPGRAVPLFHRIGIDIVWLPDSEGFKCLVVARDDFSNWPEAKPLRGAKAKHVAKFIWEDVITRHGLFGTLMIDGGSEFRGEVVELLNKYDINRIKISAYNSKGNGMIERGHQAFINALIALTIGGKKKWTRLLPTVLFADRTTVHGPTGFTPFYVVYGREAVLPVETKYPTWRTLGWDEVDSREKLLELRVRQILMRDEDVEESRLRKERRRLEGKEYFDAHHQIRKRAIKEKDFVLVYDVKDMDVDKSRSTKLQYRWLGPYKVLKASSSGYYVLAELDGTPIRRTYAGNRLKRFVKRKNYWYSPDDEVFEPTGQEPSSSYRTNDELEQEAIDEYNARNSTQEIEKSTGVIVRVPELPESERAKYVAFDDSDDSGDPEPESEEEDD